MHNQFCLTFASGYKQLLSFVRTASYGHKKHPPHTPPPPRAPENLSKTTIVGDVGVIFLCLVLAAAEQEQLQMRPQADTQSGMFWQWSGEAAAQDIGSRWVRDPFGNPVGVWKSFPTASIRLWLMGRISKAPPHAAEPLREPS